MVYGRAALALAIILLPATCAPSAAGELPWTEHPVRQGETLDSIAEQCPVDSCCIRRANELNGDTPPEGLTLLVPQSDGMLLETLAEVRARRRGETTVGLYFDEDDRPEQAVPVPASPRADRSRREYPGIENLIALTRGSAAEAAVITRPQLSWPVKGVVFSPFGPRRGRFHCGIDISAPRGTPIMAAAPGTVARAATRRGFGKSILIDHGGGVMTRYSHCDTMLCKAGDKVSPGQVIGKVGRTGRTTGPHLHFEVVIDGKHQDPQKHLPQRGD